MEAIFAPLFAPAFEWRRNVCRNFEPFCAQKKPAEANKDGWGEAQTTRSVSFPLAFCVRQWNRALPPLPAFASDSISFVFSLSLSGLVVLLNGTGSGLALGMGFAK